MPNNKQLFPRYIFLVIIALFLSQCTGRSGASDNNGEITSPSATVSPLTFMPSITETLIIQSTPTSTISLIPTIVDRTITPSITPVYENYIDPSALIPHNTLILYAGEGQEIFVQEIGSMTNRKLFSSKPRPYSTFVSWTKKGCELNVIIDQDLQAVDLRGNISRKIFLHQEWWNIMKSVLRLDPGISPDEKWLWFYVGGGEPSNETGEYLNYEIQNVAILPMNRSRTPLILSQNGGSWNIPIWSPDGKWIAYTDLDANHVHQLFVIDVNGKRRTQVTHHIERVEFPRTYAGIYEYFWSPDDRQIGVNFYQNHQRTIELIDLKLADKNASRLIPDGVLLWWIDTRRVVVWLDKDPEKGIYIYDLDTRNYRQVALDNQYPTWIGGIHPFVKPEWIGVYSGDWLYVFDADTNSMILRQNISTNELITWWTTTLQDFPGEATCQSQ